MKNVITLGKLFLKAQPLSVHTKNTRNKLARLVMGTIFLIYICINVCMYINIVLIYIYCV